VKSLLEDVRTAKDCYESLGIRPPDRSGLSGAVIADADSGVKMYSTPPPVDCRGSRMTTTGLHAVIWAAGTLGDD